MLPGRQSDDGPAALPDKVGDRRFASLNCGGREVDLSRPAIMGILNVTPDSFSDGGRHSSVNAACDHARQLVSDGADIIDIGGESTRPGATPVSEQQELDRVIPVIAAIREQVDVPISIDTFKPTVMKEAVAAGAGMINDVYALTQPDSLATAVSLGVPVCLMHMYSDPTTMQNDPHYDDVVEDIFDYLHRRRQHCLEAGIDADMIVIDPGFGFGKTLVHNLTLLHNLARFQALASPVLVGLSRKGMIGQITGLEGGQRDIASAAAAAQAVAAGARIVRVHDVHTTRHIVRTLANIDVDFWSDQQQQRLPQLAQSRF